MIHRFKENPLIVPNPNISWMTECAFNPGVIRDTAGKFHMLIRGNNKRGTQEKSILGYASSEDGIHWSIAPQPVTKCDMPQTAKGIEDPRIVWWNGSYYVFATACHQRYGRIGIWKTQDFRSLEWVGSPFDWDGKAACIIPELIGGKVYLLHMMYPNLGLGETSDVSLAGGWGNKRIILRASDIIIDGEPPVFVELASSPVKYNDDWLVLFHAIFEPYEHRVSFMILDGVDLSLKYLHNKSILRPELYCEKYGWVCHVCFLTGIVDMGDRWYVYWGGSDTVILGGYLLKSDIEV